MIEQQIASIARNLIDICGIEKVYLDDVPEEFETPSLYIPFPESVDNTFDSVDTFRRDYVVYINIFHNTTTQAMEVADDVCLNLYSQNLKVPIIRVNGSLDSSYLKLDKCTSSKIDNGVSQVAIQWHNVLKSLDEPIEYFDKLTVESYLKE
jgi:hypothetical protein